MLKIAHISDLHFFKMGLSFANFFSKRFFGIWNHLLFRKWQRSNRHFKTLPAIFKEMEIDCLVITGDLTTTSHPKEFEIAKAYIEEFEKANIELFLLPGNHDNYLKNKKNRQLFYDFFSSFFRKNADIFYVDLNEDWTLVGLNTTLPTPIFGSWGLFSEELEKNLLSVLKSIGPQKKILLANHFPIFQPAKKILKRNAALIKLLQLFPNVKLFLNGHSHKNSIFDMQNTSLPIICDAGSIASKKHPTFNFIELNDSFCKITPYHYIHEKWQILEKIIFSF